VPLAADVLAARLAPAPTSDADAPRLPRGAADARAGSAHAPARTPQAAGAEARTGPQPHAEPGPRASVGAAAGGAPRVPAAAAQRGSSGRGAAGAGGAWPGPSAAPSGGDPGPGDAQLGAAAPPSQRVAQLKRPPAARRLAVQLQRDDLGLRDAGAVRSLEAVNAAEGAGDRAPSLLACTSGADRLWEVPLRRRVALLCGSCCFAAAALADGTVQVSRPLLLAHRHWLHGMPAHQPACAHAGGLSSGAAAAAGLAPWRLRGLHGHRWRVAAAGGHRRWRPAPVGPAKAGRGGGGFHLAAAQWSGRLCRGCARALLNSGARPVRAHTRDDRRLSGLLAGCAVVAVRTSSAGLPIAVLSDGSAYVLHVGLRGWLRVADDTQAQSAYASTLPAHLPGAAGLDAASAGRRERICI
jgi:protein HIRA/HIR1